MRSAPQSASVRMAVLTAVAAVGLLSATSGFAADAHTTAKFEGVKANSGTATHSRQGTKDVLSWSDDFKIPDTPAPHWQAVDVRGNVYLLQRLKIKGDKENRTITIPPYIRDLAKIQIWCSFAEALLGEASFPAPIKTSAAEHDSGMMMSTR